MRARLNRLAALLGVWLFAAGTLLSQQYFGGLTGTVTDSSGAVLPGATVTATNLNKGTTVRVTSNEVGIYRVVNLPPDPYRIEVEASGFKKATREPLLVEVNRVLTADIKMEVGQISESVTVSDAPPVLETESPTTSSTVEGLMVNKLPLVSRADTRGMVTQLPGTSYGMNSRMMINGARTSQVVWDEDGVPNRSARGIVAHEHSINVESIKAVKITLANAGAESPAPAQISLLTASGTNDFHGSVYLDTQHSIFNANSHNAPAGSRKPSSKRNYEGLNLTGPVYIPKIYDGRNRTFFMTTLELTQSPWHGGSFITTPPEAMRRGDFSNFRNASGNLILIKDPTTGQPFSENKIPESRIFSGAKRYLDKFYPLPNLPTAVMNNNAFGDYTEYKIAYRRWDVRLDQSLSEKNTFFFRFFRFWNPGNTYYKFLGSGKNQSINDFQTYQFTDTHTIRPNLVNEFRFAMTEVIGGSRSGIEAKPVIDLLGVTGIPEVLYQPGITGMPSLGISGISGISVWQHTDAINPRLWDFFDNATWIRGRHSVKAGVNFRKDTDSFTTWPYPGEFSFNGTFTGTGLADFLLGLPQSAKRSYPRAALGPENRAAWYTAAYIQDDFKISPRLTINIGLRWDANLPAKETHGLYYNFDLASGNLVVPSQAAIDRIVPTYPKNIKFITAAQAGLPEGLRYTDKNNFAPRVGFAWRPFGERFVVRSAYGIYYQLLNWGYLSTGGPWGGEENFTNRITNGVPLWQFPAAFPTGVTGQTESSVSASGIYPWISNPYVQQWNFTLERQVEQVLFRIQYIGTKSTNLYYPINLEDMRPSTIPYTQRVKRWPQYRSVGVRGNGGNSFYNGLTLAGERRMGNGITFNSGFTWASCMTDSYDQHDGNGLQYGRFNQGVERSKWRGKEQFVPKFRWASNWYTELPFGRKKKWGANWHPVLNAVAGGWATSGILNLETGWWMAPYYRGGTDPANVNYNQGPLDRIADGVLSNQGLQPGQFFLDPKAFVMPPANAGRFGTSGLNFMQEPSWWTFDFAAQKTFPIHESLRFELLAKINNIFNHGYWGHGSFDPGLNYSNAATFGTMAGQWTGSRSMSFLLKVAW